MLGLDDLERKFGFGGAAIALVLAALFIPHLIKNTTIHVTAKALKDHTCPTGYAMVKSVCTKAQLTHPSYWLLQFLVFLVVGLAIAGFSYFRKRAGVIVGSLLLAFATGSAGLFYMALAAWLAVRAFRLGKYGDATFRGANVRARERAQERRANKGSTSRAAKTTSATTSSRIPAPSKRYTPKKTNRR
ncbi:MAG: hypothetical protein HIU57_01420 [Acidobacteria bacterium]|nr:hypothetical protein [Acidobacteriota bacterium]